MLGSDKYGTGKEWRELMAGGGAVFNRRIREGLSDKVIFEET